MRTAKSLVQRIGRRGAFLLFLALVDFGVGGSYIYPQPETVQNSYTKFVANIAPLWAWGVLWIAVGVACAAGTFLRSDRWSFAAAMALKVLWGSMLLLGWTFAHLDRGWLGALIWGAFAAVTLLIATWPEPPVKVRVDPVAVGDDG